MMGQRTLGCAAYVRQVDKLPHIVCWFLTEKARIMCGCFCAGSKLFGIDDGIEDAQKLHTLPNQHFTIIFNTFVMMTLFNEINARKIHEQHNIIEGLQRNPVFIGIWIGTMVLQVRLGPFSSVIFVGVLPAVKGILCPL